jgi:DUF438 domain-containing protein
MGTISGYMTDDHRHCDELFAQAEEAADRGNIASAVTAFRAFRQALEGHFAREEEVLFPAFEQRGGGSGPTTVMRMEHAQMRALFQELDNALAAGDGHSYLGLSETLLVMMQQHNLKEEQILYPMTDRLLAATALDLVRRMTALGPVA